MSFLTSSGVLTYTGSRCGLTCQKSITCTRRHEDICWPPWGFLRMSAPTERAASEIDALSKPPPESEAFPMQGHRWAFSKIASEAPEAGVTAGRHSARSPSLGRERQNQLPGCKD